MKRHEEITFRMVVVIIYFFSRHKALLFHNEKKMWEINVYNVNNVSKKVVMLEQGGKVIT